MHTWPWLFEKSLLVGWIQRVYHVDLVNVVGWLNLRGEKQALIGISSAEESWLIDIVLFQSWIDMLCVGGLLMLIILLKYVSHLVHLLCMVVIRSLFLKCKPVCLLHSQLLWIWVNKLRLSRLWVLVQNVWKVRLYGLIYRLILILVGVHIWIIIYLFLNSAGWAHDLFSTLKVAHRC